MGLIKDGKWKDSSRKLYNPGKNYFLNLAARCIRVVHFPRDADGLTFARKSMEMTGMDLNKDGI